MTEEQILVDLERQGFAAQVLQREHLVSGNRKHPYASPFIVFPRTGQRQAECRDVHFAHASSLHIKRSPQALNVSIKWSSQARTAGITPRR